MHNQADATVLQKRELAMRNTCLYPLLLSLFCIMLSVAQAKEFIVVGEEFPPMTNSDGSGQQFEIVQHIIESQGHSVRFQVYPYKRAVLMVEEGKADMMIGMLKYDTDKVNFSKLPHDADNVVAIYPTHKNIVWQGLETFRDKNIAIVAGLGLERFLEGIPHTKTELTTRDQAFKKMLLGREDFLIDCECAFYLEELNRMRDQFTKTHLGFLEIYAAFSQSGNGPLLKALWDDAYLPFMISGQAEAFYKKWDLDREYSIIREYLN